MMGLPYGEEIMIVGRTMWTQSTSVTDRQTDRWTDGRTDRITITDTVQTASHGNKMEAFTKTLAKTLIFEGLKSTKTVASLCYMSRSGESYRDASTRKITDLDLPASNPMPSLSMCV